MSIKIGINGFGRIGRMFVRESLKNPNICVKAINDLVPPDNLAYMLKYDSTHGTLKENIKLNNENIEIENQVIKCMNFKNPSEINWADIDVDIVIESTGLFTTFDKASLHLEGGAKRVVISAPTKSKEIPTFVMGVNHKKYNPKKDFIVSNASCTTNCLAPIVKILLDNYGFDEGLMTTVHAVTASQPTVDGPSKKDFRGGRGAFQNIIPSSTGAAKAVGLCLPEINGKLTGMAFRVPVANVSVVDVTVKVSKSTSYKDLNSKMFEASQNELKGILGYNTDDVVSNDFNGSKFSSIYDSKSGMSISDKFYKLISWYDNEIGYSNRLIDLISYMNSIE